MANIKINNVTYSAVPSIQVPLNTGSGNATFYDTADATADASKILAGFSAYNSTGKINGNATMVNVSQDGTTKVVTIS